MSSALVRRIPRRVAATVAALTCATAALSMNPMIAAQAEPEKTDSLYVAVSQSVKSFNPFVLFFSIDITVTDLAYDSLMDWSSKDFAPTPGLATKWSESPDHLTWTYTIRDNVKFTDGKPLTSKDVEFTYRTMMTDPDAHASAAQLVDNFESISAPDPKTFVVKLKHPSNQMLGLDSPIAPEHIWSKRLKNLGKNTNFEFPLVGSGAFHVTEFKKDQFIRMKANKDYWGGAPKYDELVFRYYKTPDAAVQALQSGEVDVVSGLTPAQFKALKGKPGITLNQGKGRRIHAITFNVGAQTQKGEKFGDGHPALLDKRVRQAIRHATDPQELIKKVNDGLADEAFAYNPPIFSTYFWKPSESERVKFDLAKANQILDDAGYKKGPDGIRIDPKSKRPLVFRLLNHSDEPTETTDSQYLEGWWKQIGIGLEKESKDSGKLNDDLYAGKFDIIFSGWGVSPDPTSIMPLYTCATLPTKLGTDERNTDTFYCNPKYDELNELQKAETNTISRAEIVMAMQRILYEDTPEITLRSRNVLEAYRSDRWTGFKKQPEANGMIFGQSGVWSYLSATPVGKSSSDGGGANLGLILGGVGAVVVVGLAGAFIAVRRRKTAEERE